MTDAKVVDVHYNSVTCGHDEINSMAQLNAIVSGDTGTYNGAIKVAVAHDGVNASVIYVISVPTD